MIYMPNFSDPRIIAFCVDAGFRPDVDGFYKALGAAGHTGSIDDRWKQFLIAKYGTFRGMHINAYEDESAFTFSTGLTLAQQRTAQKATITNGTCIFYWPFDQGDMDVTNAIRVVTTTNRGEVGTDYSAPLSTLGGSITPSWSYYAMRLNTSYLELGGDPDPAADMARRLVAGRRSTAATILVLNDFSECYDYYVIDPRTYAYLFVLQYVKETGVVSSVIWDQQNDTGFASVVQDESDGARFLYPSGASATNNITLPTADAPVNGEVRTVGWYYDGTANLRYGFRGVGSGDTVTWTAGTTQNVAGAVPTQEISGISSPVGKIQGMYCIEFTTPPSIATIQAAVGETRALWKAGTKILPTTLVT